METEVLAPAPAGKVALVIGARAVCDEIAGALEKQGARTFSGAAALTASERESAALFDSAIQAHGSVDIMIQIIDPTDAHDDAEPALMTDISLDQYDALTRRLARAPFFMLQQAARRLTTGGKAIVVHRQRSGKSCAVTRGAAAAVQVYARVLARELGVRGITVNSVTADSIATDEGIARIVELVNFLVSDDSRWINGQQLRAGGA